MTSRVPGGPSSSPPSTPSHSRTSSIRSQNINQHAPLTPSGLREAHTLSVSPDMTMGAGSESDSECSPRHTPTYLEDTNIEPLHAEPTVPPTESKDRATGSKSQKNGEAATAATSLLGGVSSRVEDTARETTALLSRPVEFLSDHIHPGPCNHGTFSPMVTSRSPSIRSSTAGSLNGGKNGSGSRGLFGSIVGNLEDGARSSGGKKMSTTARLAQEHGIENSHLMYVCQHQSYEPRRPRLLFCSQIYGP